MPTHVYANNSEIASKSADGKSPVAFPDVCISPGPPPPPGGIPLPYPNTCFAKDLTKITKTVFIKGKGAAMEKYSYFSKSTGDEPATDPLKRGVVSSALKGTCYFQSWSMNVKAEGKGVARHMDLVTHNHSNPANTPPVYYISIANMPSSCVDDYKDMKKRCEPDDKKKIRKGKKYKKKKGGDSASWVMDHCGPLLVQPGLADFEEWQKDFGDLDKLMNDATQALRSTVIDKLEREVAEFAAKKAVAFAARRGLTGWIPFVGWAVSAADLVYTGYQVATQLSAMKAELGSLKEMASRIQQESQKIRELFSKYKDELSDFKNLSEDRQKQIAREVMTGVQAAYGAANPCLRARKCFLVPFNRTDAVDSWAGKGCCPGQTGHHLLPDAMFRDSSQSAQDKAFKDWQQSGTSDKSDKKMADMPRDKKAKRKCWEGYSEGAAPTVCLEGGGSTGSHGAMHKATAAAIAPHTAKGSMDYDTARNSVTGILAATYGCNKKCLDAQMDAYYKDAHKCGPLSGAKVTAHTGQANGGPTKKKRA